MAVLFAVARDWRGVLRELTATLADAWACADLREHLASWWAVTTGAVKVD